MGWPWIHQGRHRISAAPAAVRAPAAPAARALKPTPAPVIQGPQALGRPAVSRAPQPVALGGTRLWPAPAAPLQAPCLPAPVRGI